MGYMHGAYHMARPHAVRLTPRDHSLYSGWNGPVRSLLRGLRLKEGFKAVFSATFESHMSEESYADRRGQLTPSLTRVSWLEVKRD